MKRILSLFAVLFFVAGCGGGSGDSNVQINPNPVDPAEEVPMCSEIVDDRGAIRLDSFCNEDGTPKRTDLTGIQLILEPHAYYELACIPPGGGHQGSKINLDIIERICAGEEEPIIILKPEGTTPVDNFEICPNPDELDKFIDTLITGDRFEVAPVLSFASQPTEHLRGLVRESVSLLNRALPEEYNITESGEDVEGSDGGALQVPEGEIYIQFFPAQPNVPVGIAVGRYIRIIEGQTETSAALRKSYVLFIAHEIMHVLGFSGHITPPTDSIMMDGFNIINRFVKDREWPREEILSAVDVWGIRYLYEDVTMAPEDWLESRCE